MRGLSNHYHKQLAHYGGEQFSIRRPDYTVLDQIGEVIVNSVLLRAAPEARKFGEPSISGAEVYNVFGDRTSVQAGDILTPLESGSGTAVITVATVSALKAMSGIMTDQLGTITKDVNTTIYKNVRFAFLPITFPGSNLDQEMAGSLSISTRRCVMFKRAGLVRGMRLIESSGFRWLVKDLVTQNNVMLVNLSLDDR